MHYRGEQIAERLNAEGFRPPKRSPVFTPNAVTDLLRALGIQRSRTPARRNRPVLDQHEWWLRDLAESLGMSQVTLDSGLRRGRAAGVCTWRPGCTCRPCRPGRGQAAPGPAPGAPRPAQPPPLAEQSGSQHEHRTGRNQRQCRQAAPMTALRLAPPQIQAPQERLPGPVDLLVRGPGAGGPQPYRVRVPLAGQVIDPEPWMRVPSTTGSSPSWSFHASRCASRWCILPQAIASAVP